MNTLCKAAVVLAAAGMILILFAHAESLVNTGGSLVLVGVLLLLVGRALS